MVGTRELVRSRHKPTMVLHLVAFIVVLVPALALDYCYAPAILRQHRTRSYIPAPGEVTSSVTSRAGPVVSLVYEYEVQGSRYDGTRICYAEVAAQIALLGTLMDRYPSGRRVTVYHHPQNPSDSVLIAGLRAQHLTVAPLILAINLVPICLLSVPWCRASDMIGRMQLEREGSRVRVAVAGAPPAVTVLTMFFLSSFVGVVALALAVPVLVGRPTEIADVLGTIAAVGVVALASGAVSRTRRRRGCHHIMIDGEGELAQFPSGWFARPEIVPFGAIVGTRSRGLPYVKRPRIFVFWVDRNRERRRITIRPPALADPDELERWLRNELRFPARRELSEVEQSLKSLGASMRLRSIRRAAIRGGR